MKNIPSGHITGRAAVRGWGGGKCGPTGTLQAGSLDNEQILPAASSKGKMAAGSWGAAQPGRQTAPPSSPLECGESQLLPHQT